MNFVDAHHIEAISPSGTGGPVDITATTANGTSTASSAFSWVPAVTKVHPHAGPTSGGTSVDITGKGFTGATAVHFGATAAPMVVNSDSDITATAPAHAAGTGDVTVTGPTGTSAATQSDLYAYGAPVISHLSPNGGPRTGGNTVTITGSRFVPGASVNFGTTAALTIRFVSASQLTVVAPPGSPGTVRVTVHTPAGTSPAVKGDLYAYGPPAISGLSPTSGPHAGGTTVTITGNAFVPGATVKFGTKTSSTVTFVSPSQLKAVAPPGSPGTVRVLVHTPGGISPATPADRYKYT